MCVPTPRLCVAGVGTNKPAGAGQPGICDKIMDKKDTITPGLPLLGSAEEDAAVVGPAEDGEVHLHLLMEDGTRPGEFK